MGWKFEGGHPPAQKFQPTTTKKNIAMPYFFYWGMGMGIQVL